MWPYYAEEKTLRTLGAWDPVVAKELLACMDAERAENLAVLGFKDFTTSDRFCNGK